MISNAHRQERRKDFLPGDGQQWIFPEVAKDVLLGGNGKIEFFLSKLRKRLFLIGV